METQFKNPTSVCSICCDTVNLKNVDAITLGCHSTHCFHRKCIVENIQHGFMGYPKLPSRKDMYFKALKPKCPLCRELIDLTIMPIDVKREIFEPTINFCKYYPRTLDRIPAEVQQQYPRIPKITCQQNGQALQFVPEPLKTKELCRVACQQYIWALQFVPEKLKTEEMCTIACQQHGQALKFVPDRLRTAAMCTIACQQDGWALESVPESLKIEEMCTIACQQNGQALEFVPEALKTEKVCTIACQQNGQALKFVPDQFRTNELCTIA